MKKFTAEQIKKLDEETRVVLEAVADGESTREIMARIYVNRLDEKTYDQGLAMADTIIESVRNFDKDYMEAREDLDKYLKEFAEKSEKDKSVRERCDYWLRLAASVNAALIAINDETVDRNQLAEDIKDLSVSEEEATEEKAEELRSEALEAIRNSGILILGIQQSEDELREIDSADETAFLLTDIGTRETETRAIMSMLAYTEIKSGDDTDVPIELTADQVVTAVCIGIEETRIAEGVENGSILIDVASTVLAVLGVVGIVRTTASVIGAVTVIASAYLPWFIAIPTVILLAYGIVTFVNCVVKDWINDSEKIVRYAIRSVKAVGRGLKTVFCFIYENVILGALKIAKKMWNRIRSKGKKNVETEGVQEIEVISEDDVIEVIDDDTCIVNGDSLAVAT